MFSEGDAMSSKHTGTPLALLPAGMLARVAVRNLRVSRTPARTTRLAEVAEEVAEYEYLTERMSALLTWTAAALKGEPGPLSMHDWSDLPATAARALALAERDQAVSELASVRAERDQAVSELASVRAERDRAVAERPAALTFGPAPGGPAGSAAAWAVTDPELDTASAWRALVAASGAETACAQLDEALVGNDDQIPDLSAWLTEHLRAGHLPGYLSYEERWRRNHPTDQRTGGGRWT
jgi:hypothetical protein